MWLKQLEVWESFILFAAIFSDAKSLHTEIFFPGKKFLSIMKSAKTIGLKHIKVCTGLHFKVSKDSPIVHTPEFMNNYTIFCIKGISISVTLRQLSSLNGIFLVPFHPNTKYVAIRQFGKILLSRHNSFDREKRIFQLRPPKVLRSRQLLDNLFTLPIRFSLVPLLF